MLLDGHMMDAAPGRKLRHTAGLVSTLMEPFFPRSRFNCLLKMVWLVGDDRHTPAGHSVLLVKCSV